MESAPFSKNDIRAVFAEFLGTMFFVFVGTGAVVATLAFETSNIAAITGASLIAIALAHGIGILTAAAWTGNVSGGHINPAVTLAMMFTRNIKVGLGLAYMVAQFAGAAAGSGLLKLCTSNDLEGTLGSHHLTGVAKGEGLLLEIILTAFLVTVIFTTAVSKKGWGLNAPIAIGLAVTVIQFVAVPFTGASVNPARSFGPFLVANSWNSNDNNDWWIYFTAPFIGALIAAAIWLIYKDMGDDSLDPDPAPKVADAA